MLTVRNRVFLYSLSIVKEQKNIKKKQLTKVLDVTHSDMLFADKVILVGGIAERLLMPLFMEKCGCCVD